MKGIFFVGTGLSLTVADVDAIKNLGYPSISCNRIDLMYPKTDWRPDYYIMDSGSRNDYWRQAAIYHTIQDYECWYRWDIEQKVPEVQGKVQVYPNCGCCHSRGMFKELFYEWCDAKPLCGESYSFGIAAQIALLKGHDTMYTVGCDEIYLPDQDNHFHEDYNKKYYTEKEALGNIIGLRRTRDVAMMEYGKRGKKIIDLTFRDNWHGGYSLLDR